MKPGDLVQLKRGVRCPWGIGVAIGWVTIHYPTGLTTEVLEILFSDGIQQVHPKWVQVLDEQEVVNEAR